MFRRKKTVVKNKTSRKLNLVTKKVNLNYPY